MGLNFLRDKLCLVQISTGKSDAHIIQLNRNNYDAPNLKKILSINYINIEIKKNYFKSSNISYVKQFLRIIDKKKTRIIEVHNRPSYIDILSRKLDNKIFSLYFHNDPLSMDGSKTITDRKKLLKICHKIIFNSNWSKKRFLEGLENKFVNSDKLVVFFQSAKKNNISILNKKKNWITFVGKLNKAKGYDVFAKAIKNILNKTQIDAKKRMVSFGNIEINLNNIIIPFSEKLENFKLIGKIERTIC